MARQGVHGWRKDPARQEAARKASATRLARESFVNALIRGHERRTGTYPTGTEIAEFIARSKQEIRP